MPSSGLWTPAGLSPFLSGGGHLPSQQTPVSITEDNATLSVAFPMATSRPWHPALCPQLPHGPQSCCWSPTPQNQLSGRGLKGLPGTRPRTSSFLLLAAFLVAAGTFDQPLPPAPLGPGALDTPSRSALRSDHASPGTESYSSPWTLDADVLQAPRPWPSLLTQNSLPGCWPGCLPSHATCTQTASPASRRPRLSSVLQAPAPDAHLPQRGLRFPISKVTLVTLVS